LSFCRETKEALIPGQSVTQHRLDRQDGHGRRHAGLNGRWDEAEANGETGLARNARTVWAIATQPYAEAHFATFPTELPRRCIMAGSRVGDTVLDPFAGAGTTLLVADRLQRESIGIELNPTYCALAEKRVRDDAPLFFAPE
jgi:DNA modification methylase